MRIEQKDIDRFWSKVNRSGECWIFTGKTDRYGYGNMWIKGKWVGAHRISYTISKGSILKDLIMHHCDNPSCVNPAHLKDATYKENSEDMVIKGRSRNQNTLKTKCKNGHNLNGDNLSVEPRDGYTARRCLTCKKAYMAINKIYIASNYMFAQH